MKFNSPTSLTKMQIYKYSYEKQRSFIRPPRAKSLTKPKPHVVRDGKFHCSLVVDGAQFHCSLVVDGAQFRWWLVVELASCRWCWWWLEEVLVVMIEVGFEQIYLASRPKDSAIFRTKTRKKGLFFIVFRNKGGIGGDFNNFMLLIIFRFLMKFIFAHLDQSQRKFPPTTSRT